ncbi:MAG TPA: tail fiber domain-containing protein, partial [Phnomibacter sp.]|nr:tail fiber domain-containing protein [Phnomibacter sp.]
MKRSLFPSLFILLMGHGANSQSVGIGTSSPHASSLLEISSTTKGLLMPRMSTAQRTAIGSPAKGLMVFDNDANSIWYHNGSVWVNASSGGWSLTGNAGTNPASQFFGTTDNQPVRFRLNNQWAGEWNPTSRNYFMGLAAGASNTSGTGNIAIGAAALNKNTDRSFLVAMGDSALYNNGQGAVFAIDGTNNIAIGRRALFANTIGYDNTAIGYQALAANIEGARSTAVGTMALMQAVGFGSNTAVGYLSLGSNTTGGQNTGVGYLSLGSSTTAHGNTAIGHNALFASNTGARNTALGAWALLNNTSGQHNVAVGFEALRSGSGSLSHYNTAIGYEALRNTTNSQFNTVIGYNSGRTYNNGYNNVFVGANNEVNASGLFNVVAVGQAVTITASSQARIGNAATNSIGGHANWSNVSDARFKRNISPNVPGLDFIMRLNPVTYHLDVHAINNAIYPKERPWMNEDMQMAVAEKSSIRYSGFLAQEVEVAALQTGYDFSGVDAPKNDKDFYGLRYAEFVVPLVKAMQEQQEMIRLLQEKVQALERMVAIRE